MQRETSIGKGAEDKTDGLKRAVLHLQRCVRAVFLSLSLSISFSLSLSLYLSLSIYLSIFISIYLSISLSLPLNFSISLSLSLSLCVCSSLVVTIVNFIRSNHFHHLLYNPNNIFIHIYYILLSCYCYKLVIFSNI